MRKSPAGAGHVKTGPASEAAVNEQLGIIFALDDHAGIDGESYAREYGDI